jgi:hypothetical protein
MAVTPATVREVLTEFAEVPAPRIQTFLDFAAQQINAAAWGLKYDQGLIYLTGHLLKLDADSKDGGGAAGPVSAETVGQVSASYQIGEYASESEFGSTVYGRRYLELRKLVFACRCL